MSAFVTLLTSDAYLPGALALAAALKDLHPQTDAFDILCLVTPETVNVTAIRLLRKAFDIVIGVEVIVPPDTGSLALLGRPDLDTALTKLHVFRLTQYSKIIFLDADVLPLRPLSHLFGLEHDFSAVPDVGWPDIFNSGVMVLSPGEDKFMELQGLLNTNGTWDGADQGLLNEWRGSDWNRLSFTYNTTPTAIYTYAPAYQRFGSQISVVHFIGPHKPWHSIAYRAPGSSTHPADMATDPTIETPTVRSQAYDYGSLVDRWYSVYDRHYRSQTTELGFQPTKYTSAWNEEAPHPTVATGVLGLEELRRVALEGMGALGISMPTARDEGEYWTMPLEGRFDLIRPRTRAERMRAQAQAQDEAPESAPLSAEHATTPEPSTPPGQMLSLPGSPVRWMTLPTPGINEIPPAPHSRLLSLPPTPLRSGATPYKSQRVTREAGAQTVAIREPGTVDLSLTSLTPNSALATPTNTVTHSTPDTYFPKVWDIDRSWSSVSPSSSETSLTTMEPSPSKSQPTPNALFSSLAVPATPEMPHSQVQSHNITSEEHRSPTPDFTKVKRVFPWEGRRRLTPGRVFPDESSPSIAIHRTPVTPERRGAFRSPMPSPLAGFPPSFQLHHLLNSRFPQRRASKIAWLAPSSSPLSLASGLGETETDSQDGDIEDEVDSEEEAILRSRSSSIGILKRIPKYRSIGVQTDPREFREEGVQVVWATTEGPMHDSGVTNPVAVATPVSSPPLPLPIPDSDCSSLSSTRSGPTPTSDESGNTTPSSVTPPPVISSVAPTGVSPLSRVRKGSRVWNPARDVESFKRGSQEVLAKLMTIGSWEEHM